MKDGELKKEMGLNLTRSLQSGICSNERMKHKTSLRGRFTLNNPIDVKLKYNVELQRRFQN